MHILSQFDQVRVINLVDRADRRREVAAQLERVGGMGKAAFFPATRPNGPGPFEGVGVRGCFESHLGVLREARDAGADTLLLLEDDFDFASDILTRGKRVLDELTAQRWSLFYGAHQLPMANRFGLTAIHPGEEIVTASFVGFDGAVLAPLVAFLEAMLERPAGSPDYGPMHVDGAYSVFRRLNPKLVTFAAFPALGQQRSSRSDITPSGRLLDRLPLTRSFANGLRRVRGRFAAR